MNIKISALLATASLLILPSLTSANQSAFDRLWKYTTLYENQNTVIQKLSLSGRLQAESYSFDADQGNEKDTLWRRARFGFKANMAQNWLVHIEGNFDLENDNTSDYSNLTDAYISWKPADELKIKILKQSAGFTLDGATSSKKLLTLQRNNITNNMWFTAEYFTGLTVEGSFNNQSGYKVGVFSNDDNDEISHFDAKLFSLLSYRRDLSQPLNLNKVDFRIDYIYNQEDDKNNTRDFSQVLSLVTEIEHANWGLSTDITLGNGYNSQSNLWGVSVMPFVNFNEQLQAVVRYTYLNSTNDNGIRSGRYEREIVSGRGDEYHEAYSGFNLFFYGHKLKWQTGLQYTIMNDTADDGGEYKGWGITTGLRAYW